MLDASYAQFTESAGFRGMEVGAVIDTQARLYRPQEALSINLIDEIAPRKTPLTPLPSATPVAPRQLHTKQPKYCAQARALDTRCQL